MLLMKSKLDNYEFDNLMNTILKKMVIVKDSDL